MKDVRPSVRDTELVHAAMQCRDGFVEGLFQVSEVVGQTMMMRDGAWRPLQAALSNVLEPAVH